MKHLDKKLVEILKKYIGKDILTQIEWFDMGDAILDHFESINKEETEKAFPNMYYTQTIKVPKVDTIKFYKPKPKKIILPNSN